MRGKVWLLVAGIIMVVCGGIGFSASIVLVLAALEYGVGLALAITAMVVSAIMVVAGIPGIAYRKRADKVKLLIVIGIILMVLDAIALVVNIALASNPASAIGGIILGVLYLIGAKKNESKLENPNTTIGNE